MTLEELERLLSVSGSGSLSPLEEKLLHSLMEMRKVLVRGMDRHPILVRAWDNDGMAAVRACACKDCIALRKAAVGILE